ncbi:hypothetical protein [Nocardia sp. NPDC004604]|uniref:hypothetical protein n=1 Tax=Nocardia sp. NPDC004604 TaxID=3157013 RepID=UPI0033BE0830
MIVGSLSEHGFEQSQPRPFGVIGEFSAVIEQKSRVPDAGIADNRPAVCDRRSMQPQGSLQIVGHDPMAGRFGQILRSLSRVVSRLLFELTSDLLRGVTEIGKLVVQAIAFCEQPHMLGNQRRVLRSLGIRPSHHGDSSRTRDQ